MHFIPAGQAQLFAERLDTGKGFVHIRLGFQERLQISKPFPAEFLYRQRVGRRIINPAFVFDFGHTRGAYRKSVRLCPYGRFFCIQIGQDHHKFKAGCGFFRKTHIPFFAGRRDQSACLPRFLIYKNAPVQIAVRSF